MEEVFGAILMVLVFLAGAFCAVVAFLTVGTAYGCFSAISNYAKAFRDNVKLEQPPGKP